MFLLKPRSGSARISAEPGRERGCPPAYLLLFAASRLALEDAGVHRFHVLHQEAKELVVKAEHELRKGEAEREFDPGKR